MQGVPGSSPGASTKFSPISSSTSRVPDGLSGSDSNCRGPIYGPIEIHKGSPRVQSLRLISAESWVRVPRPATKVSITNQDARGPYGERPARRCEVIYMFVYTSGPSLCRTGELLYDPASSSRRIRRACLKTFRYQPDVKTQSFQG